MSASMPVKGLVSRTTTVVFDLMHGGLVMAGVILTLALVAFIAGNPSAVDGLRSLRDFVVRNAADPLRLHAEPVEPAAPATDTAAAPRLPADLRGALEHVAKRYRVSATALEPVFSAAQASARQVNLDPLLLVAVIGIESGFNPLAESVMGAQGLMQIIPRFHRDKLPADDGLALFDPKVNVDVGARILRDSIRRMGGIAAGLQQFAGAADDPDQGYATKVFAEKQRLEAAARRGRSAG